MTYKLAGSNLKTKMSLIGLHGGYVYSGVRYFRRKSRKVARLRGKGAIAWWCVLGIVGFFALNLIYQIIRKPGELFAPISGSLSKSPDSTWQSYGGLFEKNSTSII
ncbi:MAG TPA: hypothetical protein VMT22_25275, partial [Terriglobales bacterium]|nr:hypothetical protein [Terriglobales bacterium]